MMTGDKITEIFCLADDFCKYFSYELKILNCMFTPGNVEDRQPLYSASFIENVKGKLCGDKGYIGKQLFEFLFMNDIQLVTKVKNNMKNSLMTVADKIMLRKRAVVEPVND